ncbi:MAG: hypothetical protein IJV22_02140 [Bacteroidales bacterium]|nr:hypothetical protein [Bacteroidales bacterium]
MKTRIKSAAAVMLSMVMAASVVQAQDFAHRKGSWEHTFSSTYSQDTRKAQVTPTSTSATTGSFEIQYTSKLWTLDYAARYYTSDNIAIGGGISLGSYKVFNLEVFPVTPFLSIRGNMSPLGRFSPFVMVNLSAGIDLEYVDFVGRLHNSLGVDLNITPRQSVYVSLDTDIYSIIDEDITLTIGVSLGLRF